MVEKTKVAMPSSKVKVAIAQVLKDEGYIENFQVNSADGKDQLEIALKYYAGSPVIERIERVSRPGLRVYRGSKSIPQVMNGLGVCGHQIEAIEQSLKAGHVCVHLVDAPERHYVFQSVVSQIGKYFSIKEHDLIIHFPRRKQHSDLHRQASHVDHLTEVEEVKHRMTMNNDFPVQLINLNQDEVWHGHKVEHLEGKALYICHTHRLIVSSPRPRVPRGWVDSRNVVLHVPSARWRRGESNRAQSIFAKLVGQERDREFQLCRVLVDVSTLIDQVEELLGMRDVEIYMEKDRETAHGVFVARVGRIQTATVVEKAVGRFSEFTEFLSGMSGNGFFARNGRDAMQFVPDPLNSTIFDFSLNESLGGKGYGMSGIS